MISVLRKLFLRVLGTLAPRTAARWIGKHMATPYAASPINADPKAVCSNTRIPYAHGWLSVSSWGEGPTVLLLHGWGGRAANMGAFVDPLVDAGFRVVAYDAPAHGESNGEQTSLIECAGAAILVGRTFGPLQGVVAHSFGAPTAALAFKYGLTFDRVVFLGPPLSVMDLMIEMGESFGLPRRTSELMVEEFERQFSFQRKEVQTDKLVEGMDIPLLVIHDERDKMIPVVQGAAVAKASPAGNLIQTDGLGHRGVLTDNEVVAATLEFIPGGDAVADLMVSA